VPNSFALCEPSIVYQEVCGALARRVGLGVAEEAKEHLNTAIRPRLLVGCDRQFCVSAYPLCSEYGIYAIDALYFRAAISRGSVLVSLDKEDFTERVKRNQYDVEVYHVSEFPY
jgi:predicted nucleic acid-binding protein